MFLLGWKISQFPIANLKLFFNKVFDNRSFFSYFRNKIHVNINPLRPEQFIPNNF